ncbi:MAG TPA: bifunctional folylpolyglutamate synthase/dihydrofolate synthase [Candidatus Aminicenantes bacterium]|nr:bifunctional folylpolyglutamate synthase/dihydrofolate synthase [Candidatus Aminicenantes bacterium]HDT14201.1 bifunctional folylpolyglutamate synthase/dihydrofolate synthase [Candidatus Aminicenantes bacterium]
MTPSECRDYLGRLEHFGVKLGLENIQALLLALGNPQNMFLSVHVAGTNGKGSVGAMLAGIARAGGFKAGLYTSPHLVRVEERVRIDGRPMPPRRFRGRLARIKAVLDGLMADGRLAHHPTYFEVLTALAFLEFAERQVDIAVLEVGMGGRFDATNVVRPLVSVVTTIARDHEKHLGSTLRAIAFEKAGIIKPGVPVVCGVGSGEALREIKRIARERRAPIVEVFGRGRALETRWTRGGHRFTYAGEKGRYLFTPGLAGRHQGVNAATAIATAEVLSRSWKPLGKPAILKGIRETRWEGRLETVRTRPLVLLDGAHNVEGVAALVAHIREGVRRPVVLVFAAMRDKDLRTMTRLLFSVASAVVLTRVPYKRSADPEDIAAAAPPFEGRVLLEPDARRAVRLALELSRQGPRMPAPVVIAGSLFLIGEIKRLRLF